MMCSVCAEHDVCYAHDVRLRRMMCLRTWAEHIASFCGETAKHHYGVSQNIIWTKDKHHLIQIPDEKNRLICYISRFSFKCALTHHAGCEVLE